MESDTDGSFDSTNSDCSAIDKRHSKTHQLILTAHVTQNDHSLKLHILSIMVGFCDASK